MNELKIEDLSVDDWVQLENTPFQVMGINPPYVDLIGNGNRLRMCDIDSDNLAPIPITAEILEKNGFVKESEVGYERFEWRENGSVAITLNRDSFSKSETFVLTTFNIGVNGWLLKIEHVHQLQNAIRLAGIEKEIEV